jgi:prolyl-tRNA editing enzyme YbaK/EbsC (Cys-tRNA(Pro) deacylase)
VSDWPEPVEQIAAFLRDAGAEARIEQFPAGTSTAADAARAVGCSLAQIVKTLVVDCDGRPVAVLVPGDRRADADKVARATGTRRARPARPDEVRRVTGVDPGAVAPFGLPVETVLVDPGVLVHELVWVGAGSSAHVAGLAPAELARLARARPVDVVQSGT